MGKIRTLVLLVVGCMVVAVGAASANRLVGGESADTPADTVQRLHDELKTAYESRDAVAFMKAVAETDTVLAALNRSDSEELWRTDVRALVLEAQRHNDDLSAAIDAVPAEQRQSMLLPGVVPALGTFLASLLATLTHLVTHLLVAVPVPETSTSTSH